MSVTHLSADDVDDLAKGCALLGSGGGGDTMVAVPLLVRALEESGGVDVVASDRPPPDAGVVLAGAVGSPTVMTERLPSGAEFVRAVRRHEEYVDGGVDLVAPLEIGGVNGLLGILAAVRAGLPLLDGDGMGRAFPRQEQCLLQDVVPAAPVALAHPGGGVLVLEDLPAAAVAPTVRGTLPSLGGWAAIALYRTDVSTFAAAAVTGSVSRALRIGRALADRQQASLDDHEALALLEADSPIAGTVLEVRRAGGDNPAGTLTLQDQNDSGRALRVDFVDEYVCAQVDGAVVGCAPDILVLVDPRSWRPVPVSAVSIGQRLRLLRMDAPEPVRRNADGRNLAAYGFVDASATAGPRRRSGDVV